MPSHAIGIALPQGWGDLGRQIGILVRVDVAYETVRGIADGQRAEAIGARPAGDRSSSARPTRCFEPGLQAFFLPVHWLIDFANQIYLNSQFSIALAFLVWLYLFRNESYYFVRNMFVVSMGLALVGYTLYPTAPPRMFPEHGFVDTITDFSNVNHDSALAKIFINPYAAVPSMHCAFAADDRRHRLPGLAPPLHQGLLGLLAAAGRLGRDRHRQPLLDRRRARLDGRDHFSSCRQRLLARARPEAWAWRSGSPQEAEA